jgi:hypothetical protein
MPSDIDTFSLHSLDFYDQPRFIDQITGHSGLKFFDALKTEIIGAKEVEQSFPVALKGPILRRVQFQTISRIDNLVDLIYDEFKNDYFPGEEVTVHIVNGDRIAGVVREKTTFGAKALPNGQVSPAFHRYYVTLPSRPQEEAVVDDDHITRDRKIFTKQVLRSFIKKTVTREAWTGAPWLVRPEVAEQYHIETKVPVHLRYETAAAERKQKAALKKTGGSADVSFTSDGQRLPELKPAPKSHKAKGLHNHNQEELQGQLTKSKKPLVLNPAPQMMHGHHMPQPAQFHAHTFYANGNGVQQQMMYQNGGFQNVQFQHMAPVPIQPPPPPPIKYPIEDLQVAPKKDGVTRPTLKYFSEDTPVEIEDNPAKGSGIKMESVGPSLEMWDTLNVYCEVFKLDSFTFDDFVEAMRFSSEDVECELFVEVHCAALKLLVDAESDGGKINIRLPVEESDDEEDWDESQNVSAMPTPTPEPEPKPFQRATRRSLKEAELQAMKEAPKEPTPEPALSHLASEMNADFDWLEHLRKRDFKNGGWEAIIVGLLFNLTKFPRFETRFNDILEHLAPTDMDATPETARQQYASMDVNLRIKALQVLVMLTTETREMRRFMEECAEQMTGFRKEKIKWQRVRKDTYVTLLMSHLVDNHTDYLQAGRTSPPQRRKESPCAARIGSRGQNQRRTEGRTKRQWPCLLRDSFRDRLGNLHPLHRRRWALALAPAGQRPSPRTGPQTGSGTRAESSRRSLSETPQTKQSLRQGSERYREETGGDERCRRADQHD